MRAKCKIDDYTFDTHDVHNGVCTLCYETSDEASEFDFIRAWYALLGEDVVTADDVAIRIGRGHLPNVKLMKGRGTAKGSTEEFLKTLMDATVVMNNGITIVDVVVLPDGAYRTVRRRDETDTLMRTPNTTD